MADTKRDLIEDDKQHSVRSRKSQDHKPVPPNEAKDVDHQSCHTNSQNGHDGRGAAAEFDRSSVAVSTREYSQAFRQWLVQYQWWAQAQMPMMYMFPMHAMSYFPVTPQLNAQQTPVVNGSVPSPSMNASIGRFVAGQPVAPGLLAQPQQIGRDQQLARGRECRLPALWKRIMAEFIDFLLLFVMKLAASVMVIEYIGLLDIEKYDLDQLLAQDWDPATALSFTSDLIAMEIINRIFICLFETLCLRRSFAGSIGGTTPGKYMMRLRVISCHEVIPIPGNKILVVAGEDIGFWNAFLRAIIKNFSLVFFFPVCFTVFFFPNNRTAYDIASCCIVVEVGPEDAWAWPRR